MTRDDLGSAGGPGVTHEAPGVSRDCHAPHGATDEQAASSDSTVSGAPGAMLVIVSGPSGVGKDTVIQALCQVPTSPERYFVVTATTRPRRDYEIDGVHYHFLDEEEFQRRREAGGFLEANLVHGYWYGTPREQVRHALTSGRDAILKIDVQGAAVVKQKVPEALLVFLVPPSLEDLFARLQARATETADQLDVRQRNAALELARQEDYDYVVRNETGQVDRTAKRIDEIIRAEKAAHPDRRTRV
ncbi:MAG TPA: guanylate kinase [Candidatus Binatia bacterium]|nr:guanylate kinase [Candidatus Binatia bacterium]